MQRTFPIQLRGTKETIDHSDSLLPETAQRRATGGLFHALLRKKVQELGSGGDPRPTDAEGLKPAYWMAAMFAPLAAAAGLTWIGLKTHDPKYVVIAFYLVMGSVFIDMGILLVGGTDEAHGQEKEYN